MSRMPPHLESNDAGKSTDLLVGRTIGEKFALEAILGAGAMGAVYRARQIALEKTVAVKVMHRGLLADPTFATRFHREAKAASRLDHPHSIRILDFGEEPDGLLYIVMDYLDGRDLLRVIQEDWPLQPWRTVQILSQALSALAVAHDMGVLHRDLKPENIMVLRHVNDDGSPADVVKVLDFGIAKITETRESDRPPVSSTYAKLSTGGMLVGTPAYMSPEQAQGEPLDARSDLYSVGIILYQMLTMCLPFEAASAVGLLLKHVHEKPPAPSSVSSAVHPGLEAVCLKAMSKQRRDRYPNAREMRAALRAAVGMEAGISGRERYEALSPSPQVVHVGPRPPASRPHANADMATMPSIPSLPPSDPRLAPTMVPPSTTRFWMLGGAALIIGMGAFFLPRLRRAAPVAPAQGLVSPTPTAAPAALTAALPPFQREAIATNESQHRWAPASATSGASRKGARGKAAPPDPAPENAAAAVPSTAPEQPAVSAQATAVAPPPIVEPPAVAPPAPVEPPEPPPAPPPRVPLNPALARVEIGVATSTTGTTASNVNKTIAPLAPKLTACYRSALAQQSQATDEGGVLHVETNEEGVIMEARLEGPLAAGAGRCIVAVVRGRRISNVDTGSASADVPLGFKVR